MRKNAKQVIEQPYNRVVLSILAAMLFVGNTLATTYYVRNTGDDANAGTSPSTAVKKLKKAFEKAKSAGDVIYVGAGTHSADDAAPQGSGTSGNPCRFIADTTGAFTGDAGAVILTKKWNQGSENYWTITGLTINGDTGAEGVDLNNNIGMVFQNCTITGRKCGVIVAGNTSATFTNCILSNNNEDGFDINSGNDASVINITNCLVQSNVRCGIKFKRASGIIKNCLITGNGERGFSSENHSGTLPTIWNCIMSDNTQAGLKVFGGTTIVKNCAMTYNATYGIEVTGGTCTNTYNNVFGNTTANFSGASAGTGGISADPKYTNRAGGDFTLLTTSPMINAGTSGSGTVDDDLNADLRPMGPSWDMGCYETPLNGKVLLVATSTSSPLSNEASRRVMIQGFDFRARYIDDDSAQATYDAQIALHDVAYVSSDVVAAALGTKLTSAKIGVVNELASLTDDFGFCATGSNSTGSTITIASLYHYITSPLGTGSMAIFSSSQPTNVLSGTTSKDTQVLARWGTDKGLAVLESGARRYDSGNVAGRRVQLPWGGSSFAVSALNSNGQTMMKGAIQWAKGLVAYWKLNETSGTAAADSGPYGYNGTVTGTATWQTTGKLDGDISLNGATYAQASGLMTSPSNVTIAGWADLTALDSSGSDFISIGDYFKIRFTATNVAALFYNGTTTTGATKTGSYVGGGWHHFAAVFDNESDLVTLYIDGESAATLSTASSISYSGLGSNTQIGRNGNGSTAYDFTGAVDDVRVYNYALSADEVLNLRYVGQPRGMRIIKWVETQ